jgi:septum formation protein
MVHLMILFVTRVFMKKLYVGSKSSSRQKLLRDAGIAFELVGQDADETVCDWNRPFCEIVASIALHKMQHVILPAGQQGETCFVLTADTLTCNAKGIINGKPVDREDAIRKIKGAGNGVITGTAFCLDKKIWRDGSWHMQKRIERYVQGACSFVVPDAWLECYLAYPATFTSAGAVFIEGFGAQFVKDVQGSYSAIIGMPMFELREALTEIGY